MRTVNIVGMGPSALSLLDHVPDGEIWGINYAYNFVDLDRLFVVHRWDEFMIAAQKPGRTYRHWMTGFCEGYIKELWTYLPLDILVPSDQLPFKPDTDVDLEFSHHVGGCTDPDSLGLTRIIKSHEIDIKKIIRIMQNDNFTCSLPYVIGQAIVEEVDVINLFGIEIWDYGGNNKYSGQIPAVNAILNAAIGRGIRVNIPWQIAMKMTDRLFIKEN